MIFTKEQKEQAVKNAQESLRRRLEFAEMHPPKSRSFAWVGHQMTVGRTQQSIRDMQSGKASDRQYAYWLKH